MELLTENEMEFFDFKIGDDNPVSAQIEDVGVSLRSDIEVIDEVETEPVRVNHTRFSLKATGSELSASEQGY